MSFWAIVVIAFGLAADCFAVSITAGITSPQLRLKHALIMAGFFGFFQGAMPVLGWLAGVGFRDLISNFDHWIAAGLLGYVGGKMIWESVHGDEDAPPRDVMQLKTLLLLAIATSIDALAVGLTFSLLNTSIVEPAWTIGIITFFVSLGGVYLGKKTKNVFGSKVELLGGILLLGIGAKILYDHLLA